MEDDTTRYARKGYEAWVGSMAESGIGVDEEWLELSDADQNAWRAAADKIATMVAHAISDG